MRDPNVLKLKKWPFLAGDALVLAAGYLIYYQARLPLGLWEMICIAGCASVGALLACAPYWLEYRAAVRLAEQDGLTTAVAQIENLQAVGAQIANATGQWQNIQDAADKTAGAAKQIAERMTAEAKAFGEFLQRANDSEKANLRLEVEKLRRSESDWLQVLVRMLDHVYALQQGALRSGQPTLIEQVGNFQNACREAARRVGLAPFVAEPNQAFDAKRHEPVEGNGQAPVDGLIEDTVATGYTFQGRMLRPALVRLRKSSASEIGLAPGTGAELAAQTGQSQLPLSG